MPPLTLDSFSPAVRAQIDEAYSFARSHAKEAGATGRLGMVLQTYGLLEEAEVCYRRASQLEPAAHLWIHQRNGTFKEMSLLSGTAYSADGLPQAGMGVTAGDFDGDGDEDIFKTNLMKEGANLYVNDGRGNFYEGSAEYGLLLPTFPYTGFGTEWFDYDNDGRLDLFVANGAVNRIESLRGKGRSFAR